MGKNKLVYSSSMHHVLCVLFALTLNYVVYQYKSQISVDTLCFFSGEQKNVI